MKLWEGRMSGEIDERLNKLNASIGFDMRMYRQDIAGSIAHARMLGKTGIIDKGESEKIVSGLEGILTDLQSGALEIDMTAEDIHTFVEGELTALQREVGITFVFVTHSQQEALALSHRIAVMNEGRIEQVDCPEQIYGYPKNRFVADFIGTINLLPVEVCEATHGHMRLAVAGLGEIVAPALAGVKAGERGTFALRPEQVRVSAGHEAQELHNHYRGKVLDFLYLGDVTVYKVELDNGVLLEALLANSAPGRAKFFEIGDTLGVGRRHDSGVYLRD